MRGWRIHGALATALLAALALALAVGPAAASAGLAPTTRVTVKPGSGTPQTRFAVSFRVPVATGTFGSLVRTDTVSVSGPRRPGCQSSVTRTLHPARKGKKVKLTLRPASGRGGWCAGRWRGTVVQSELIRCTPIGTQVCPQLVVAPRTIGRFSFRVKPSAPKPPPSGDVPKFAGLISAVTCPSPPVRPAIIAPGTSSYTLTWDAATDPVTPSSQIVYEIFVASSAGGENYATPTYTTSPGATSFRTPAMPRGGTVYFVVRARNAAGREDSNTVERQGIISCPPVY